MRFFRLLALLFSTLIIAAPASAGIDTTAEHAILMDGASGQVLWAKAAFTAMPPASMSKLMTIELLFQRLKDHRVKLTDTFPVSETAWKTGGSKMFVSVGSRIAVEDLIRGIIIQSGNDACVVVAESLGGSVGGFVRMMNDRAKQLGLPQSHFVNPDGLPDPPGQLMSAMDLAKLARHLITAYPEYYHYFGERSFVWNNITQPNRNLVLEKFPGADGLKTGHTDLAGYGITTSAVQNGQRLILVLNGLRYPDLANDSPQQQDWFAEQRRADEAARILGVAFREFRRYTLFKPNDVVGTAHVWNGGSESVPLKTGVPVNVSMQVDSRAGLKAVLKYDGPIVAPIAANQQIGTMTISAPDFPAMVVPVYAAQAVPEQGLFGRMMMGLHALISGNRAPQ